MFKVSHEEWEIFFKEYNDYDSYERLGQAFLNRFRPEGHSDPGLFYETNTKAAIKKIYANYIGFSTPPDKA